MYCSWNNSCTEKNHYVLQCTYIVYSHKKGTYVIYVHIVISYVPGTFFYASRHCTQWLVIDLWSVLFGSVLFGQLLDQSEGGNSHVYWSIFCLILLQNDQKASSLTFWSTGQKEQTPCWACCRLNFVICHLKRFRRQSCHSRDMFYPMTSFQSVKTMSVT